MTLKGPFVVYFFTSQVIPLLQQAHCCREESWFLSWQLTGSSYTALPHGNNPMLLFALVSFTSSIFILIAWCHCGKQCLTKCAIITYSACQVFFSYTGCYSYCFIIFLLTAFWITSRTFFFFLLFKPALSHSNHVKLTLTWSLRRKHNTMDYTLLQEDRKDTTRNSHTDTHAHRHRDRDKRTG